MEKLKKRKNQSKNPTKMFLLIALLFMGIGFALISADAVLKGDIFVASNEFDVHFDNINVGPGSMSATTPVNVDPTDDTKLSFSLNLTNPGEYYEFEVDVINGGTIAAKVSNINFDGLDANASKYMNVTYTYADGTNIELDNKLGAGESKRIKVRVDFLYNINLEDLPASGTQINLSFGIEYIQDKEV